MNKNILGLVFVLPFFLSVNTNGQESTNKDVEEVVVTDQTFKDLDILLYHLFKLKSR